MSYDRLVSEINELTDIRDGLLLDIKSIERLIAVSEYCGNGWEQHDKAMRNKNDYLKRVRIRLKELNVELRSIK